MHRSVAKKNIYRDCRKAMLLPAFVLTAKEVLGNILTVYTATVLGSFADSVFNLDLSLGKQQIIKLIICILIIVILLPALKLLGNSILLKKAVMHDRVVFSTFFCKEYHKIAELDIGATQYRLENEPNDLRYNWVQMVNKYVTIPITLIYLIYSCIKINILYTVITFGISIIKLSVPLAIKKLEARYDMETREYQTKLNAYEGAITLQPHIVKMLGLKNEFISRLDSIFLEYYNKTAVKDAKCKLVSSNLSEVLDTLCEIVIIIIGAIYVASGKISTGNVTAMIGYFSILGTAFSDVGFIIHVRNILNNITDRMEFLYTELEPEYGNTIDEVADISARNLAFSYDSNKIFSGLNFHINPKSKVAVCGENGSGKSTLIKVLCRLLKSYDGVITVNGKNIESISLSSWRNQIGYAEQNPFLFSGSVKENIQLANLQVSDKKIEELIGVLGITQIKDREISMKSTDLSGGERQKIALARAIVKNSPIIILDEPVNNLDNDSLNRLELFIRNCNKTIIYVSHDKRFTDLSDMRINM